MADKQTTQAAAATPASPSYYGGYSFSPSVNSVTSDFFLEKRIPAQGGNIFSLMRNTIRQSYKPDIFANTSVFAGRVIAVVDPLSPDFVSKSNNVFSNVYNFYRQVLLEPDKQLPILFKVIVPGVTDMIPPPNVAGITQRYLNEGLITSRDDFLADQHPTFVSVNNDVGKVFPGSWVTVQFANMYKMFSDGPQAAGKCLGVIGDLGLGGECFLNAKYGANAPGGNAQTADEIEANKREGISLNRDNAKNIVLVGSLNVQASDTLGDQLVEAYTSAGYVFYTKGSGTYDVDRKVIVPQENSIEKYIEEIDKIIRPTKAQGTIIQFENIFKNEASAQRASNNADMVQLAVNTLSTLIRDVRAKIGSNPIALIGTYNEPMIGGLTNGMIDEMVVARLGPSAGEVQFFSPDGDMSVLRNDIMNFINSGTPTVVKSPNVSKQQPAVAPAETSAPTPPPTKQKIEVPAKVQKIVQTLDVTGKKVWAETEKIVDSLTAADALKKIAEAKGWDTSDTAEGGNSWKTILVWQPDEAGTFTADLSAEEYRAIAVSFGLNVVEASSVDIGLIDIYIRDAQAVYEGNEPPSGREVPGAKKADTPNVQNAPPATDPCAQLGMLGQGMLEFDEGSYPPSTQPLKHRHGNDTGGTLPYLKNASTEMEMVHDNNSAGGDWWWSGGIEEPRRYSKPKQFMPGTKLVIGNGPMESKFHKEAFGKIVVKWLGGKNAKVGRRAYAAWALAHAELVKAGYGNWKWDEDGGYTGTYQWNNYVPDEKKGGTKKERVHSAPNAKQPGLHGQSHHSMLAMDFRAVTNWFTTKRMKPGPKGLEGHWTGRISAPQDPATPEGLKWWKNEYGVNVQNLATKGNHPAENKPYSLMVMNLPGKVVKIMKKYGFRWGGDYGSHKHDAKTDAMHFEFFGDPRVAAELAKSRNVPDIVVAKVPDKKKT